jgi:hypothetical protein
MCELRVVSLKEAGARSTQLIDQNAELKVEDSILNLGIKVFSQVKLVKLT